LPDDVGRDELNEGLEELRIHPKILLVADVIFKF
jgi:hypothetical protein